MQMKRFRGVGDSILRVWIEHMGACVGVLCVYVRGGLRVTFCSEVHCAFCRKFQLLCVHIRAKLMELGS